MLKITEIESQNSSRRDDLSNELKDDSYCFSVMSSHVMLCHDMICHVMFQCTAHAVHFNTVVD